MTPATTLTTDRLTLRLPQAADLQAYTAFCISDRARYVLGPFDAVQAFNKLCAMLGHWTMRGFGRYVMDLGGRGIGHVGPLAMDDRYIPEFTWTIWDPAAEGQGLATEAALAVKTHLFEDLGWTEMIIRIQPENAASCRIAERIGGVLTDEAAPDWYPGAVTYRLTAKGAA